MLRPLAVLFALVLLTPAARAEDGPAEPEGRRGGSLLSLPFLTAKALLETIGQDPTFSAHPYSDGPGYLLAVGQVGGSDPKPWAVRAGVEEGNDFNGLNRVGLRAWLDTESRLGVTTNWDRYDLRLPCGCRDTFFTGDLVLTARFVQAERVQMHAGLGARGLFGNDRAWGGGIFLLSADVFPVEPLVLSAQAEAGTLRDAALYRLRATAGVQLRHAELFAGFDYLRINHVDLYGPMVGLRLWF